MTETVEVDTIDVLEPKAQNYYVTLPADELGDEITLVQKPLTFFGKMEFFSVLGGAVDKALNEGLSLGDLLDVPDDRGNINAETFKEADLFVKAVLKLVKNAPELLLELYTVILAVPRNQRDYIQDRLQNISDEDGIAVLEHFVDQNWEVMADFFTKKITPLTSKISSKFQGSESSKPSKATRQNTRKK